MGEECFSVVVRGKTLDLNLAPSQYTCHKCDVKDACDFAYDEYNTHGDCLAVK